MEIDNLGNGLVNVVLGALILWVAQTTFQHSGELAGVDQKFDGINAQQDNLRARLDTLMSDLNDRTRSRFTSEDGDKLASKVEEVSDFVADLERRIADRVTDIRLKVIALQTQGVDQREVARLRTDVERLHASLYSSAARGPVSAFAPVEGSGLGAGRADIARAKQFEVSR